MDSVEVLQTEIVHAPFKSGIEEALSHYGTLVDFCQRILQKDVDFGIIPGTKKPTLLKPGAEKLCQLFSLRPKLELISSTQDWTGQQHGLDFPLFSFHYRVSLCRHGELLAEGEGVCSSAEYKYRKQGQQGIFNSQNTICKMAQKRALVAAVLVACGASEFFTQDMEDFEANLNNNPKDEQQCKEARAKIYAARDKLGWSNEEARKFASETVGATHTDKMSLDQLLQLLEKMQAQVQSGG